MIAVFDALLAPLARLMVARGIPFPELVERLKIHYVEAAKSAAGGRATDSRLSVLTGLQRRDIARLRDLRPKARQHTHLSRLVALWQTERGYRRSGKPIALPRSGPAPSFEALARTVRRDVHPRTMLDTLVASGTVELVPESQHVRLVETSYQPLSGSEDQLAYLANNVGDHLAAATDNVVMPTRAYFERAVHYSTLTQDQVAELERDYRARQMTLLKTLSAKAARMKRQNKATGAPVRFRAGGYFYHEDEESR